MRRIKYSLATMVISLAWLSSFSQSSYNFNFDTDDQKAGWVEYRTGKTDFTGWEFQTGGKSDPNKIIHFAPTGDANKDSFEDWFVSRQLNLEKGGTIDSLSYNYFTYFGTFFEEQSVDIRILVGDRNPSQADSTIVVADFTDLYVGDNDWRDTGNIALPTNNGKCYLAFRFVGIDGWSSISFDDIKLTTNATSSVLETKLDKLTLYPNPATNGITLQQDFGQHASVEIHNMLGEVVFSDSEVSPQQTIYPGLRKGIYLCVITVDGITQTRKLQVQ